MNTKDSAIRAKEAFIQLSALTTEKKNNALLEIANELKNQSSQIEIANKKDLEESIKNNLSSPLLKRLKFDKEKIFGIIEGIHSLIKLPDPVGTTLSATEIDENLELYKVTCPIGVIGIIFESRPDALVQISTLCLKSGNAILLKGGSEAYYTNKILTDIISNASLKAGIIDGWIHLLESRLEVNELLKLDEYVDLIVPRGSNEFVRYIMDNSRIPVLGHADGICHVYVDADADIEMAKKICIDSKTQYVAVCNALETLLVHKSIANDFLPELKKSFDSLKVELVGCENTVKIISIDQATQDDWKTEYLDYKLSIKIVENIEEAIKHINTYGSKHTDTIVTNNNEKASVFFNLVDSGNVFWNCSTRFSDGYRYGLGAEVGVSTNKIHARGPVGLEGLVIYKWMMKGNGHVVSDYAEGRKKFIHQNLNKKFIN